MLADARAFFAKFSPDGELLFEKYFGTQHAKGFSLAIDQHDNVYVGGSFYGTTNFDGISLTARGREDEEYPEDVFIAKYNSRDEMQWVIQDDASRIFDVSLATDGANNVVAAVRGQRRARTSQFNSYVAKYRSDGDLVWTKQPGGDGDVNFTSVATDSDGRIHLTGDLRGTINFDAIELSNSSGPSGASTTFVGTLETRRSSWDELIVRWWTLFPIVFIFSAAWMSMRRRRQ